MIAPVLGALALAVVVDATLQVEQSPIAGGIQRVGHGNAAPVNDDRDSLSDGAAIAHDAH